MRIVIDHTPDREQLRRAIRHMNRRAIGKVRLSGIAFVACGGFLFLLGHRAVGAGLMVAGLGIATVGAAMTTRSMVEALWASQRDPVTYELTDDGVRYRSELSEGFFRWPAASAVEVRPDAAYFRFGPLWAYWVPLHGVGADDRAELTSVLTARGLLPTPAPRP